MTISTCPISSKTEADDGAAGLSNAPRSAALAASLDVVRGGIADAAHSVGRDPRDITLVAVTKTFPASDVAVLAALGQQDVGENRDQEARRKIEQLEASENLRWHLVGQLQSNKARSVARYAHAVHSLDRLKLVGALADGVDQAGRADSLTVFLQVDLGPSDQRSPDGRGGAAASDLAELADAVASRSQLRLAGLMTVAPLGAEPEAIFDRLAVLSDRLRVDHPGATSISAGMSQDYSAAIRHGATHVRIGSALLGRRSPAVG